MKWNLSALVLIGEMILITILHVVKHNQQISTIKDRIITEQQAETPSFLLDKNVVYKINK